ncbi:MULTISPECIES: flagellar hook-associated protein FlgK [unclassified Janthinobacterium]|uniref:flagellar hook-associated protein FlgK n=1 Tax=unclassified Janthinobacterium TaxID=2610881 RepID=UPI001608898A|nr:MULTISPECIES: flagellar hook-associated protein FlgK [unclassified Janthinobacterium]MBB5608714.1 flagellar hook-associated protein 1 FlgK [Janthinobacterium sp. S3T4]MBB5613883.1 flagellar hook-associated protein 1 FlgK [Janthinobacterium sp. S3M3]
MTSNLLSIGKSGLLAAQVGLATTGHNITNANVDGYNRQVVLQQTSQANNAGYGFVGTGTEVSQIKRQYDSFMSTQVNSAQATTSSFDAYYTQISQIDNLMADTTAGLSPALQDFFKGVQDFSSNPTSVASRQALLSSANSLAARFQSLSGRLTEIGDGVNSQITSNVTVINSYAKQIAALNSSISQLTTNASNQPNDLLDQRDQLVAELNKYVKTTSQPGSNNTITVSIGSGQPLVVGDRNFELAATPSLTDPSRVEVGYVTGSTVTVLPKNSLTGGSLGGLLDFRSETLDTVQNSLGKVAIALATTFNDQHKLGQDLNGAMGTDFFKVPDPVIGADRRNSSSSTTVLSAKVSDPTQLTASDYSLKFDGSNYVVTRQSDGAHTIINPYPQTKPQTIDGVDFSISGTATEGDNYVIKPTANGASGLAVLTTDVNKLAAGSPITTSAPVANTGNAKLSPGSVDSAYLNPGNALSSTVTLTYDKTSGALSGFPAGQAVTVKGLDGASTTYPAGTANIPYKEGDSFNFGGVNISMTGAPAQGDTFTIAPNSGGVGDNRNAAALASLQTKNILDGGKATFQGSYAQTVSYVGNKTREVQVSGLASMALLQQNTTQQQSVSGVNLDEEAANLLRYQQAYQACGKVMQIASTLFDVVIGIAR